MVSWNMATKRLQRSALGESRPDAVRVHPAHDVCDASTHDAGSGRGYRWFVALLLAAVLGFAAMDVLFFTSERTADGVSYLDMADAIAQHNWHAVINGYWNPGYPAVLYLGRQILGSQRSGEYFTLSCINFGILLALLACLWFFVASLAGPGERGWTAENGPEGIRFSRQALIAFALIEVLGGIHHAFRVPRATPDNLVACFVFLAAGLLLRLRRRPRFLLYALLGLTLGVGYLIKEVFLPIGALVTVSLLFFSGERKRRVLGMVTTALLFVAVISPQVWLLSAHEGRLAFGGAGKLNYLWLDDGVGRDLTPPFPGDPGSAMFTHLQHPPRILSESPRIEEFAQPVAGTFPLWYDPSYWNAGVDVRMSIRAEIRRLVRETPQLARSLGSNPYLLGVLIALVLGGLVAAETRRKLLQLWPLLLFGAAFVGIYLLVEVESRYIAPAVAVLLLTLLASFRFRSKSDARLIGTVCVLFAGVTAILAQTALHEQEFTIALKQGHTAMTQNPYRQSAAALISAMDLRPGDAVACIGDAACYHPYWAREAGVHIVAMVAYRGGRNNSFVEAGQAEQQRVLHTLASTGAKAAVIRLGVDSVAPPGWTSLGDGLRYAIRLNRK